MLALKDMKKSGKDNKSGSQSLHNRSSGNHGAAGPDPMSLLDPVSLFGKSKISNGKF